MKYLMNEEFRRKLPNLRSPNDTGNIWNLINTDLKKDLKNFTVPSNHLYLN